MSNLALKLWKRKGQALETSLRKNLITKSNPRSPISEQYRTIRTNIQFTAVDQEIRSLLVTSGKPGEGKSTTAMNMATVFAQQGKKVLLVDADMRKPTIHYTFNLPNTKGLTTILTKNASLRQAVVSVDVDNLDVLTCGAVPPNPAEIISSRAMKEFYEEALQVYDLVVFDSPPILIVTDAQLLANLCDGSLLVVAANQTEKEDAVKAKEQLTAAQGKLLGVILNKKKRDQAQPYYYYSTN